MKLLIVSSIALLAASAAHGQSSQPTEDKLVCKADRDPDLGSNIRRRKKTCMLASEWKELDRLNEQAKRRIQEKGAHAPAPVAGYGASGG